MADLFLTGTQGQGTDQPASPIIPAIPSWDGSPDTLQGTMDSLTDAVRVLAGQRPSDNNTNSGGFKAGKSQQNKQSQDPKQQQKPSQGQNPGKGQRQNISARFTEVKRNTQQVKIVNPQDETQYVIVKQITRLIMQDNVTKEQWEWTL